MCWPTTWVICGDGLVLPRRIKRWSLTSLQQRLVKTGGRLIKQARYYWLLLAEGPSESAVVRQYAAEDLGLTAAEWVGRSVTGAKLWF